MKQPSSIRREWGAVTFVATVLVGLVVVPLALYFGHAPAALPPVATASPSPSISASASPRTSPAASPAPSASPSPHR